MSLLRQKQLLWTLSAALVILPFQNCGKSLQVHEINSSSPFTLDPELGAQLYTTNCASCHGALNVSVKLGRTVAQITNAIATQVPMSGLSILNSKQIAAISAALNVSTGQHSVFTCTPGQRSKSRLLKLTNREFRAAIFTLLDDFNTTLKNDSELNSLISQVPGDAILTDRNTIKEQAMYLSQQMTSAYFEVAFRAGALISTAAVGLQNYPNTSSCLSNSTISQTCHQSFVRELGARAYRRPLTAAELTDLSTKFWNASYTKSELLQTTFAGLVSLPDFMYKAFDSGPASTLGANTLNMTAYELAAKLSFFLVGTPPDSTLRSLAASGQILNQTTLNQQIDRLIATANGQEMIRRLFRESYGYDVYDSFTYTTNFLGGLNTAGLATSMTQELDWFFPELIVNRSGSFSDLMTSRLSNIGTANLAQVYASSTGLVTLGPERAGFLSRASMLAKRSGNYASPIKRGLKVLEHVLCEPVPPPPLDAPPSIPPVDPGQLLSTRQRTHNSTEQPGTACFTCHSRMNPLGYAFEGFDSLGRLRTQESIFDTANNIIGSLPIDSGATTTEFGGTLSSANSQEMSAAIGASDKALMCFARHLKSFESRTAPELADSCQMNQTLNTLYGSGGPQGSVLQGIKSFIYSEEFKQWTY